MALVQLGDRFSKRLWVYNLGNDTLSVHDVHRLERGLAAVLHSDARGLSGRR